MSSQKSQEPSKIPRGRPRKFDTDEALTIAMRVFWNHGYAGASISTLLKAMGISRASLYATFGDKEELFRKVMNLYERDKENYMLKALEQSTAKNVAEQLLIGTLALQTDTGSMGVVHSVSNAPGDEDIRAFVLERGEFWRQKLIERMMLAREHGDFPEHIDARSLALSLKAASDGLLVAASTGATASDLEGTAAMFLTMWPGR